MQYIGLFSRVGYCIGNSKTNDLLIHNREDLKHFRETTLNKIVIMGRKTVESLPKKLEDRFVICLSRDKDYKTDKADVVLVSVDDVIQFCNNLETLWKIKEAYICGGSEVLNLFSDVVTKHIVTEFDEMLHNDVIKSAKDNIVMLPVSVREQLVFWTKVVTHRGHEFNIVHYAKGIF